MVELRIPVQEFRSLPPPDASSFTKLGVFYAHAAAIPKELANWQDVNPRHVNTETNKTYDAIVATLTGEPEHFFERNRGLTISAKDVEFDTKRQVVTIKLTDKDQHGVLDGIHTLSAILSAQDPENRQGADWPAYVFVRVETGLPVDEIPEIASGLNTSRQVDLKSIENLKDHFDELQKALANESYADLISYEMYDQKPIDVREVLYYLKVFDCDAFSDEIHPWDIFGRKEKIIREFAEKAEVRQKASKSGVAVQRDSFQKLVPMATEILKLRDLIEIAAAEEIVRIESKEEKKKYKGRKMKSLRFLPNVGVDRKVPLGWIMPMLGGFRANVDTSVWNKKNGSKTDFWKVPIEQLVEACTPRLLAAIKVCQEEVSKKDKPRPEYVGRYRSAWTICYDKVKNVVLSEQRKVA